MKSPRSAVILACCVLLALAAYRFAPLLGCLDGCFVDVEALHGPNLGAFEFPDILLNAWILSWVQHGLVSQPLDLFNANVLYPARNALAGSEHLIGLAVLTLPVRLFTANAVFLYQLTLMLSGVILAFTSFGFVRWFTGSLWASLLTGAVALFMPWRTAELTHLQILGAHWFPLIWLLVIRILVGDGRRRDPAVLCAVLTLQLLSSFYLAYILSFTLAVICLVGVLMVEVKRSSVFKLVGPMVVAYSLLLVTSIPYLARQTQGEIFQTLEGGAPTAAEALTRVWTFVAPSLQTLWSSGSVTSNRYSIPAMVGLLALLALVLPWLRKGPAEPDDRRQRLATWSLWLAAAGGVIMMIGPAIRVGEHVVELPSYWANQLVPGFSNLRAPRRWGLILGVASPLLAGIGVAGLWRVLVASGVDPRRRALRAIVQVLVAVSLLISIPWQRLPARAAWQDEARVRRTYEALRDLPYGPVVEIPWRLGRMAYVRSDARYMLASTFHWRPILNGFTAYLPRSFQLLRRVAQRLPDRAAVATFGRLTDVRWILVHLDGLSRYERGVWEAARERDDLALAYADENTLIFELPRHDETGLWMGELVSPRARGETLGGVPRTPLQLPAESGRLTAGLSGPFVFAGGASLPGLATVTVTNSSDWSWPGFDYQDEGLVELRYTFAEADGTVVKTATARLDAYLEAQAATRAYAIIFPPKRAGSYRLCFDLVQRIDGESHPLPVQPAELPARVVGAGSGSEPGSRPDAVVDGEATPGAEAGAVSPCAVEAP